MKNPKNIERIVIRSRVFLIVIQYFANLVIPDHDAGVFKYPKATEEYTVIDGIIGHLFGGFVRWDAHYFMHIAKYGYTYENTLAFFPLFPYTIRLISCVIEPFVPLIGRDSLLLLLFLLFNIIIFILASRTLYKLTTLIFNESIAYKTIVLFSYNPASIFFTAPYSECLFSYLTFQSILNCLNLFKKYSNLNYKFSWSDLFYLIPISLSTIVRANGILNIGFLVYTSLCLFLKFCPKTGSIQKGLHLIKYLFINAALLIICLIPFIVFQIYCYLMFCKDFETSFPMNIIEHAKKNEFIMPGHFSIHNQTWCHKKVPLAYSHVQDYYWNVGFLKYYELKQIPNFLLAFPILFILVKHCIKHIIYNFNGNFAKLFSFEKLNKKEKAFSDCIFAQILNVFIIHALFLSVFCVLFIHIQVSTRMLCSASPLFYWVSFRYLNNDNLILNFKYFSLSNKSLDELCFKLYIMSYFIIGTIMFCNFLPWT